MWNEPTSDELHRIPRLYATRKVKAADTVIHTHFFLGGSDWYVAEYDPHQRLFYGYTILNNDLQNAEWGYISYDELRAIRIRNAFEVDHDLHWEPQKASEIEPICAASRRPVQSSSHHGLEGSRLSPRAIAQAQAAIDRDDRIIYDVAATYGQIVENVRHMPWFVNAVAQELGRG